MTPVKTLGQIQKHFLDKEQSLCVAESCTGGLLSFWFTSLAGSSKYFKGGLVSYAADIKIKKLGLDPKKVKKEGLVTKNCAESMAHGVKKFFQADWALSTTGVAGPARGSLGEPLGTVAFSVVSKNLTRSVIKTFEGPERQDIRHQASLFALDFLLFEFKCYTDSA